MKRRGTSVFAKPVLFVCLIAFAFFSAVQAEQECDPSQSVMCLSSIEHHNSQNRSWKARFYPQMASPAADIAQTRLGVDPEYVLQMAETNRARQSHDEANVTYVGPMTGAHFPTSFDAREKWPRCSSIRRIPDQSKCGSCWAVSAASVIDDRLCIAAIQQGRRIPNRPVSPSYFMGCCYQCIKSTATNACSGGFPDAPFDFFARNGAVSGGDHRSQVGCWDYEFPPCGRKQLPEELARVCNAVKLFVHPYDVSDMACARHICPQRHYRSVDKARDGIHASFDLDLQELRVKRLLYSAPSRGVTNEQHIMWEIITNGPVQANYLVCEDFLSYSEGVYDSTINGCVEGSPKVVSGHSVRIIGWGQEDNIPYWLVANSWSSDWGVNGLFKIRRNDPMFESAVVAPYFEL